MRCPWDRKRTGILNDFSFPVLLSASLREHAGIGKDTVIVGVGDKAEIWSAERWQARNAAAEQMIEEGLDDLNLDI